jgi:hypothetical protein
MRSNGACDACKSQVGTAASKSWKSIGEEVLIEVAVGGGKDRTNHEFFQCPTCGSIWVRHEDSGAGGRGRYLERLTKSLF